jgi:two-component system NtrC family sensor kinase
MNIVKTKYKIIGIFVAIAFLFCSFSDLYSQKKTVEINDTSSPHPIGKFLSLFKDVESIYKDSEIVHLSQFESEGKVVPVMNTVTKGNIWVKFAIVNQTSNPALFLSLPYSNISEISFYRRNNNKLEFISTTGNNFSFSQRIYRSPDYVFPLNLRKGDTSEFFLKIKSTHPILLPLLIKSKEQLDGTINNENLIFGLYFGIILSLIFYNLFLFISTRDLSYLFYIIYLFFLGLAQTTASGYGFKYLWPNLPGINSYALIITTAIAAITGILFAIFFLRIAYYYRNFIYLLSIILLLYFAGIVGSISGNNQFSYGILNYTGLGAVVLLITISALIGKKGYRPAYFYLAAWIFLLAGIIILILRNINILPYTSFTTYASYIGSALEAILLSFALADRINTLRKEKEESQVYALKISQENEKLIREQNIVLEQKVAERTDELQNTNHQLSDALANLQDAQIQLVEAEKMASLGQLTAGIAHEINNPINFVKANIKPLKLDIDDLFEIIHQYNELHNSKDGNLQKQLKLVYEKERALDMNFVKAEIQQLLKGIEDGAERTAEIVRGLKTFSRLDEGELKTANVHDGIESTLVLLRNSLPPYIRIEKRFDSKGNIECFPGKLNQVFMNILNNSIQAIGEKKEIGEEEFITISTHDVSEKFMHISIKDTGPGMNEQVRHRIFEPFFTTKAVGEGTGLGMAIVFKIVEEHNGKIEVLSQPGKGAEFIITLPHVHPPSKN